MQATVSCSRSRARPKLSHLDDWLLSSLALEQPWNSAELGAQSRPVLQASAFGHRRATALHCSLGQALDDVETIRRVPAAPAAL
jgi:hypothetical protein